MVRKTSLGFTLIELLIVIAVLGILAVAVLAAINPIEQINRSRDTGSRSDSEQLISAIDRFYASSGYYPWQTGPTDTSNVDQGWLQVTASWADGNALGVLAKMSQAGTEEIKSSFATRIVATSYNPLFVYNAGVAGSSTYMCFLAKSSSFQTESGVRCTEGLPDDLQDVSATVCPAGCAATKTCYSCLP